MYGEGQALDSAKKKNPSLTLPDKAFNPIHIQS